jgi:uncharacterized protein
MNATTKSRSSITNPWYFFALALALSWLFWIPLALIGEDPMQFPYLILMILGGLGPAMAEAILIFVWGSQRQKRDYGRRVLDVRRIGWRWAAVIFLMFPALNAIATLLSVATGGPQPTFETVTRLLANPLSIIPYLLFLFVFGPLPEELGWSGYALDGLQARRSALTSSLIIGLIWAVWHLPLFFMHGTFQSEQIGFATPAFWWYMLPTLPISVLDTWIYNNANRSTLSAALLHFMVNLSGELFGLSQHARFYQAGLIFVVTAAIIAIWGPKTLTRQPMVQKEDRLTAPA